MEIYKASNSGYKYRIVKGFCKPELRAVVYLQMDNKTVCVYRNINFYPKVEDFDKNNHIKGLIRNRLPRVTDIKVMENMYIINNIGDIKQGSHRNDVTDVKNCDSCSYNASCHKLVCVATLPESKNDYVSFKNVKLTACSAWEAL